MRPSYGGWLPISVADLALRWQGRGMPEMHFDDEAAQRYDVSTADRFTPEVLGPTVDFMADHARGGRALELGIGTGRVAIPLAARGIEVSGIDLSPYMLERLRAKPEAAGIEAVEGDFATTRVPGSFALAYLVFNTITNLTTQDEQVACFENVARHLEPGGLFVMEVFVPILQQLPPGEVFHTFLHDGVRHSFDEYDVVTQILHSHHYWHHEDGTYEVHSAPYRYAWPAELDLMARIAGLGLVERWGDWDRRPFTAASEQHVSVWQKSLSAG
jgi:SAM-dependent methyltransferase